MRKLLKRIRNWLTPNRFALILGSILIAVSLILLVRMEFIRSEIEELDRKKAVLTEELKEYEQENSK